MDSRRIAMTTLAVLTLLAPLGCRRFLRPCNSTPRPDVAPDDRRFLMIRGAGASATDADTRGVPSNIVVVLNWIEELKARMHAKR